VIQTLILDEGKKAIQTNLSFMREKTIFILKQRYHKLGKVCHDGRHKTGTNGI